MGFYGDLIKILAHTGLQTGGNIIGQMVTGPMIAERQGQQKLLEAILPTMISPTATEEQRQAAAKTIEGITKTAWPTAPMSNPSGTEITSPMGAQLTAPRSMALRDLAPGYSPTMGLIRPPGTLEQMKVAEAQGFTPSERKTALFPKDATLEAARMNLGANLAFKGQEGELNRASRESIAQQNLEMKALLAQQGQQQTQQWRDFLKGHMQDKLQVMTDTKERALVETELAKYTALEKQLQDLPIGDQVKRKNIMQQLNAQIQGAKNPILKQYPLWTEEESIPGTGYFGTNIGTKKKNVPVGTKSTGVPTASTTPSPLAFPRVVKAGGQEVVVNSQEEYDALKMRYSK